MTVWLTGLPSAGKTTTEAVLAHDLSGVLRLDAQASAAQRR
ncbi:MAG TPA: hypothetical protein VMP89_13740 [Solirubrobacteraceae bacterium]|nr:hypothetical protein [Solirubrobacteraceae bacterium]